MGQRPVDDTLTESPAKAEGLLRAPEACLFTLIECERPLAGSSRHLLRGTDEVMLERGPERDAVRREDGLHLTFPNRHVSSKHARIRRLGRDYRLEDLASRNGTRVNGEAISHRVLADGDLIEVGRTLLLFRSALHAAPDLPLDVDSRTLPAAMGTLATLVPAFAEELAALERVARTRMPVLLRGETGAGKEVVARAVHRASGREGAFVAVNCGAIPATLVESQLFGHAKGAFSGAVRDEVGFLRAADRGTLLLDEVGDLPSSSQAALLRVLQEGEVVPLGTTRAVPLDVRILAATHQPLEAHVARGTFRKDLLARLAGFTFTLPSLAERREDLGLFVGALLGKVAPDTASRLTFASDAARALLGHAWPMNVRELEHCLSHAVALVGEDGVIPLEHLPKSVTGALAVASPSNEPDPSQRLRAQIEDLLVRHDGNVAEVARAMGKARMQVHRWMKRFGLEPKRYR